jgi:hypothetical protein
MYFGKGKVVVIFCEIINSAEVLKVPPNVVRWSLVWGGVS